MIRKSDYNTKEKKWNHIYKYWTLDGLLELLDSYLNESLNTTSFDIISDDQLLYNTILNNCKTKKELLDNYLDIVWDIVWEEYSYA